MKSLCPYCSSRRKKASRAVLAPVARGANEVLFLRLSLPTNPSLKTAWEQMQTVKAKFVSSNWLTRNTDAWFIQYEVTKTVSGWNCHAQILLFDSDPARLRTLATAAPTRWLNSARDVGTPAHATAQYSAVWSRPLEAVRYVTKGLLAQKSDDNRLPSDGLTPGDILALFVAGDADAADDWYELEGLLSSARRRRWTERGGALRGQAVTS